MSVCVSVSECECRRANGEATAVTLAIWVQVQHSSISSPAAPTATSCPHKSHEVKGTPGNQMSLPRAAQGRKVRIQSDLSLPTPLREWELFIPPPPGPCFAFFLI